jgi:hypothetical protein
MSLAILDLQGLEEKRDRSTALKSSASHDCFNTGGGGGEDESSLSLLLC